MSRKENNRPFKAFNEARGEMMKHQPFGWIMDEGGKYATQITQFDDYNITIAKKTAEICTEEPDMYSPGNSVTVMAVETMTYEKAFYDNIKFLDGTPFAMQQQ